MVFEYEFDEPNISTEDSIDMAHINGLERYSRAGEPVIPVKPAEILIPPGMKIGDVTSTAVDTFQLPGTYRLALGKKSFRRLKGKPDRPAEPDAAFFQGNDFWPGKYHELVTVQSNRGYQIAYVHLFPLQYLPQTGEIKSAAKIRLELRLVGGKTPHRIKPTKKLKQKLERKIDNPDTLDPYDTYSAEGSSLPAKDAGGASPLSDPACPYYGANYRYIVITSGFLADENNIPQPSYSFQKLCASKTARGIAAGMVTTDWIFANYDGTRPGGGTDNATRIRNFLKDAYQTWGTEYALLGGNKDIVPVRNFADAGEAIPADLYYGCVDPPENTFDADGDGKYGEPGDGPGGEEVDLIAEIFIGRAAVENGAEVVNFVRKTLSYESTEDNYLNVAATIGGYLGFGEIQEFTKPFGELIRLGSDLYLGHFTHGFESPAIADARAFRVLTLYDEDWYNANHEPDFDRNGSVSWDYYTDGWSAANDLLPILNAENGNTSPHLIYISDHGDTSLGMVKLYTDNTRENNYDHLGNLQNTNYFFLYDDSCYVGSYDCDDSFGEEITTMEHGAFAAVLNSRYGWGSSGNTLDSPSTQFTREFFESVLGEGILELGRAHQEAKESNLWRLYTSFWGIRYIYYELNLFGDPELRLRVTEDSTCTEGDTRPTTCGTGACARTGTETCTNGVWGGDTCEPGTPASETCNTVDDDCDGETDEGLTCTPAGDIDTCPDDPDKTEPGECGCGVPEGTCAIADADGDNVEDAVDNCPNHANAGQADADGDGLGDVCDPLTDADNDGMPDDWETQNGLDPGRDDAAADPDADGISNLDEYRGDTDPAVSDVNDTPDAPLPYAPLDGETTALTPQLQTEAFFDPDYGDTHRQTRWQIIRQADDRLVLDVTSDYLLTSLSVPKLVLQQNRSYRWRVRFFDNHGLGSHWSQAAVFATGMQAEDADANGILDAQEVDALLDLDANGTADLDQADIKCVNVQGANGQVGLSLKGSAAVAAVEALESINPDDPQFDGRSGGKPAHLPFGLIHFRLRLNEAGAAATVTVHLSAPAPADGKWYKFDPIAATWLDYSDCAVLSSDRRSVTLTITDGGFGDLDGSANGIIIDPSGLSAPGAALDGDDGSGAPGDPIADAINSLSDGNGCFIGTAGRQQPQTRRASNPWLAVAGRLLTAAFLLWIAAAVGRKFRS